MSIVKLHMFSSKDQTPIYKTVHMITIKDHVPKGSWLGVVEKKADLYKVIYAEGEGWIYASDVAYSNSYDMKISRDEKGNLVYAI